MRRDRTRRSARPRSPSAYARGAGRRPSRRARARKGTAASRAWPQARRASQACASAPAGPRGSADTERRPQGPQARNISRRKPSARRGGLNKICLVLEVVCDLLEQPALLAIEQQLPRGIGAIFDQLAIQLDRRKALGSRHDVVDVLGAQLVEAFLVLFHFRPLTCAWRLAAARFSAAWAT